MFAKLKQKTIEDRPKAQTPKPATTASNGRAVKVTSSGGVRWALIGIPLQMPYMRNGLETHV